VIIVKIRNTFFIAYRFLIGDVKLEKSKIAHNETPVAAGRYKNSIASGFPNVTKSTHAAKPTESRLVATGCYAAVRCSFSPAATMSFFHRAGSRSSLRPVLSESIGDFSVIVLSELFWAEWLKSLIIGKWLH